MDTGKNNNNNSCIVLKIELENQLVTLRLCPIYSNLEYNTDFEIIKNKEYIIRCPKCNSILNSSEKCNQCAASLVQLHVQEGGFVRFCSRANCTKPSIEFENLEDAIDHFHEMFKFG
ncbi:MAG: hypothetical protein EAX90_12255 [Candidatus Heimdallarchaeota archaeon]|nr:hypothetical protein [Candidatus Heimdallarchaeota archaeon]